MVVVDCQAGVERLDRGQSVLQQNSWVNGPTIDTEEVSMSNDARSLMYNCPKCGALIMMPNITALRLIEAAGACHACRLAKTVEHLAAAENTELLTDVLRFMEGYEGFRIPMNIALEEV